MYRRQTRIGLGFGGIGASSSTYSASVAKGMNATGSSSSLQNFSTSSHLNGTNNTITANSSANFDASKNSILYAHQASLKRLPVPTLKETCKINHRLVKINLRYPFSRLPLFRKCKALYQSSNLCQNSIACR